MHAVQGPGSRWIELAVPAVDLYLSIVLLAWSLARSDEIDLVPRATNHRERGNPLDTHAVVPRKG